jgi:hypothetical protein
VDNKFSESWFVEAVNMINSVSRSDEVGIRNKEDAEGAQKSLFKSDDFEFILGSFDGKQDVVTDRPLR